MLKNNISIGIKLGDIADNLPVTSPAAFDVHEIFWLKMHMLKCLCKLYAYQIVLIGPVP